MNALYGNFVNSINSINLKFEIHKNFEIKKLPVALQFSPFIGRVTQAIFSLPASNFNGFDNAFDIGIKNFNYGFSIHLPIYFPISNVIHLVLAPTYSITKYGGRYNDSGSSLWFQSTAIQASLLARF